MAQSPTHFAAEHPTPQKPCIKINKPFFNPKPKQPYDGLLMATPEDNYDEKREDRFYDVQNMLYMARQHRCYRRMANWKNNSTFEDDDEDKKVAKRRRSDSVTGVEMSDSEGVGLFAHETGAKEKFDWNDPSALFREADAKKNKQASDFGKGDGPAWATRSRCKL